MFCSSVTECFTVGRKLVATCLSVFDCQTSLLFSLDCETCSLARLLADFLFPLSPRLFPPYFSSVVHFLL